MEYPDHYWGVTYLLSSFLSEHKIKTLNSITQIFRLHSFEKYFREKSLENAVWKTSGAPTSK